jgi:lipopolysaccharide export system permease protein
MTFGNLGESFELVAIKSAGIPLLRFMQPLLIVSFFIGGIAFLFANNIIPVANLKLNALKYDIIVAKPAFDIKEGIFYDKLEGYIIKIGKKEKNDSVIHNVIIYEKNYGLQDQFMIAESGIMRVTPDKRFLEFKLQNGWNYQENGNRYSTNTEFIRMGFKDYKKEFDLRSFKLNRTEDSLFKYNPQMYSVRQLNHAIDSLGNVRKDFYKRSDRELKTFFIFIRYADSTWPPVSQAQVKNVRSFDSIIPDSLKSAVSDACISQINVAKTTADIISREYVAKMDMLRKHRIEWHRKFTLSGACIVLFMIGAPLGSIIRKGGLGTPLIFAIIFFVLFHLLNTFGEKFARQGIISELAGMWLSTAVLIPAGIFLTVKAMRDSQMFNKEFYFRLFKSIHTFLFKLRFSKSST